MVFFRLWPISVNCLCIIVVKDARRSGCNRLPTPPEFYQNHVRPSLEPSVVFLRFWPQIGEREKNNNWGLLVPAVIDARMRDCLVSIACLPKFHLDHLSFFSLHVFLRLCHRTDDCLQFRVTSFMPTLLVLRLEHVTSSEATTWFSTSFHRGLETIPEDPISLEARMPTSVPVSLAPPPSSSV